MKAILIDDEDRARRTLSLMLEAYCPDVQIVAQCKSVPEGVLAINKHRPDLVFLDIEMPEYNGFELLGFFREVDFEIIFVTAYNQYALQAFEVSAVDYVLKPVDGELLQRAVEKAKNRQGTGAMQERIEALQANTQQEVFKRIALPVSDGLLFVSVEDILLLEAEGAYTKVYLRQERDVLVSKSLKFFEDILKDRRFFYRPHRSYIVNINYVKKFNRSEGFLELDNKRGVPISRDKKSAFEQWLKQYNLMLNG